MDPAATLAAWIAAESKPERAELADAYNAWIKRGGFPARATVNGVESGPVLALTNGRWARVGIPSQHGPSRNVHAAILTLA